ncbi:uncharacterized protein LOC112487347 [Cynoglossus semilaevis]|uniref:uncharacterized protein LOC112487347 n=1 Tax=Cynoglossus semilaevis TaxID=244447 RepID=UPI000D627378|nr:uncharacterized protein LOC112487347 [Cynoglossus semilaevis]
MFLYLNTYASEHHVDCENVFNKKIYARFSARLTGNVFWHCFVRKCNACRKRASLTEKRSFSNSVTMFLYLNTYASEHHVDCENVFNKQKYARFSARLTGNVFWHCFVRKCNACRKRAFLRERRSFSNSVTMFLYLNTYASEHHVDCENVFNKQKYARFSARLTGNVFWHCFVRKCNACRKRASLTEKRSFSNSVTMFLYLNTYASEHHVDCENVFNKKIYARFSARLTGSVFWHCFVRKCNACRKRAFLRERRSFSNSVTMFLYLNTYASEHHVDCENVFNKQKYARFSARLTEMCFGIVL